MLRIGYLDPFAPFCFSRGARHEGRFLDALRARASDAGQDLSFHPGAIGDLPQELAAGRIDAIAAKAVTAARGQDFTFSEPLLETAAALFAKAGNVAPAPDDIGGRTIATPGAGPLVAVLRRLAPEATILETADYPASLLAVLEGKADFAALNADAGATIADDAFPGAISASGPRFEVLGLALAVSPGDPGGVLARLGFQRASTSM